MAKFLLKRIGYTIITLFVLCTLTFFMMYALPGDPIIGEKAITDAVRANLEAKYGLDKPVWQQFLLYMGNAVRGDFGMSMKGSRQVADIIGTGFPYSFDLGMRALIFAVIMGILLGILAAVKRGTWKDTTAMLISLLGVSVPSFIIGAVIQYVLAVGLFNLTKQITGTGISVFAVTGWNSFNAKLLPPFALSFSTMAIISRLMRTSMLDVLGQDYIKTAKAKGLSQSKIIWKHAVRNAILPVITVLGPISAAVLTGAFVVEQIYGIPGMGKFFVQAVGERDYTLLSGITMFYGAFLIIANLIVDLAYSFIDPRIKLEGGN